MPGARPTPVLPLLLLLIVAAPLVAQDAGAPPRLLAADDQDPGQRILGTVNGEAITSADVAYALRLTTGQQGPIDATTEHIVRRKLGEQILLAGEAERLGVELTDGQVADAWQERFGQPPDFDTTSGATSVKRQKEIARWVVLSDLYLLHKVGLRGDQGQLIAPDPLLQRVVSVTPAQLKELFRANQEALGRPASVAYAVYPCDGDEQAREVARGLAAHLPPDSPRPIKETVPDELLEKAWSFSPSLLEFLRTAEEGSVSEPTSVPGPPDAPPQVLVVQVEERQPARPAVFTEVQEELRRQLQNRLLIKAREQLIGQLRREAAIWPDDLLDPSPAEAQAAGDAPQVPTGP